MFQQRILIKGVMALLILAIVLGAGIFATLDAKANSTARTFTGLFSTSFTYQGRLLEKDVPANGLYDLQFQLFEEIENGDQVSDAITLEDVLVSDGNFTVELDFGPNVFTGATLFLEIRVRPGNEDREFVPLSPLQKLTAAPLALSVPGFFSEVFTNTFNIYAGTGTVARDIRPGVRGAWVGGSVLEEANTVTDHHGMVLGGAGNRAGDGDDNPNSAMNAIVVGGNGNSNGGALSVIVSGRANTVEQGAALSIIGGGRGNRVDIGLATIAGGIDNEALAQGAAILGGKTNRVTDEFSTIGGGVGNLAGNDDGNPFNLAGATVAGGTFNQARGADSFIGGGSNNVASGNAAAIAGGTLNVAEGAHSFAAGMKAKAMHDGTFVWSDGTRELTSAIPNQFAVLATGGVFFATGNEGVVLSPGSGTWASFSDRDAKENVVPVDGVAVLEAVAALPLSTWNYKSQDPAIRHMGPMAQDFHAAFQLGEDNRHIGAVDADGVALAAIQGLYQLAQMQQAQIDALLQQNTEMAAQIVALQEAVK